MPVYNTEKYLHEAIESILNQTFADYEFLIFNDGSTDKSLDIIQSYADQRIKIINSELNRGYIHHLNQGIAMASGTYIARMDADDMSLPTRFEKQIQLLSSSSKLIGCSTNMRFINKNGALLETRWDEKNDVFIPWELLWDNPICHPSIMLRSEVFKKLQYNEEFRPTEDYDMWIRLSKLGTLGRINESLLQYRILQKSEYHKDTKKVFNLALEINNNYVNEIGVKPAKFHAELTNFWSYLNNSNISNPSMGEFLTWIFHLKKLLVKRHSANLTEIKLIDASIYSKIVHKLRMQNRTQKLFSLFSLIASIDMFAFYKYYRTSK